MSIIESQLDAVLAARANVAHFATMTDAAVAADPLLATPVATPRTGQVTYATLGSIWDAAKYQECCATIQTMLTGSQGAQAQEFAFIADRNLTAGFNPQDPKTGTFVASIGAVLIGATAAAATPIVQADIDAISTATSYPAGDLPVASDITAARARIAVRLSVNKAMIAVRAFNAAILANADAGAAAKTAFQATVAAL
jgi:hypothetical protein